MYKELIAVFYSLTNLIAWYILFSITFFTYSLFSLAYFFFNLPFLFLPFSVHSMENHHLFDTSEASSFFSFFSFVHSFFYPMVSPSTLYLDAYPLFFPRDFIFPSCLPFYPILFPCFQLFLSIYLYSNLMFLFFIPLCSFPCLFLIQSIRLPNYFNISMVISLLSSCFSLSYSFFYSFWLWTWMFRS